MYDCKYLNAIQEGLQTAGRLDNKLTGRRKAPGIQASGFGLRDKYPASGLRRDSGEKMGFGIRAKKRGKV